MCRRKLDIVLESGEQRAGRKGIFEGSQAGEDNVIGLHLNHGEHPRNPEASVSNSARHPK